MNILQFFAPKDRELAAKNIQRLLAGDNYSPVEYMFLRKDGTAFPSLFTAIPRVCENKVTGLRGVILDITERKKAEEIIRKSEDRYRELANFLPEIVFETDLTGKITFFSQRAHEISGFTREDLEKGMNMLSFVIPEEREMARENMKTSMTERMQGEIEGANEYILSRKDGSTYPALVKTAPIITENKVFGLRGLVIESTERKKNEVTLTQERIMLESVTSAIGAGLVIISKDYHVLWANDFVKRYKGDTIGKMCYASLNSLIAPCLDCGVAKIFEGKTTFDSHEYFSTAIDGNPYWVEIVATPIKDENGNVTFVVEIALDITERKKNEEKLREIIYKNELTNEKLHVLGSLTRHDVGNKLMVVKSNIYLLKKLIGDNPKLVRYLEDIDLAIKQSDKMFEFSRFYEKIGVEDLSNTNVAQCFNQAAMLLPNLGAIKIVNDCQGLEVMADSLLKQLFYNFFDNSLKHGEKVTQIHLQFTKDVGGVKLFYEDNGVGIPEADKPRLFIEGFSGGKSTGLGLFLIKKMVEAYGWTITEDGKPGMGAKFTIFIPKINRNGKTNFQIHQKHTN